MLSMLRLSSNKYKGKATIRNPEMMPTMALLVKMFLNSAFINYQPYFLVFNSFSAISNAFACVSILKPKPQLAQVSVTIE